MEKTGESKGEVGIRQFYPARFEWAVMAATQDSQTGGRSARPWRWWPAVVIVALAVLLIAGVRWLGDLPFQERNIGTSVVALSALILLLLWWLLLSRAPARWRLGVFVGVLLVVAAGLALFRIRGVSGDLVPIFEPRWARPVMGPAPVTSLPPVPSASNRVDRPDFPQFLGPDRTARVAGPALDTNWTLRPPEVIWRQPVGAAWSGFAIVGPRALTQEQHGEEETVRCYDLATGRLLWSHGDVARYQTTIAGEGPRCTPTVVGNRVVTLGATGILNCLDLETGRRLWSRRVTDDAGVGVPGWGFSGSPLVMGDRVLISAGGKPDKSVLAYALADGAIVWTAGSSSASYGSLVAVTLAGVRHILAFNSSRISAHDAGNGTVLWEYPWGVKQPHVAVPVVVDSNKVIFSSGYGVGSELLEITRDAEGRFQVHSLWHTIRMKAKMANLVAQDGFLYGLDDGMLACVDLVDGSQRWKEGRYGHGQGLWVGDLYLLMAENGELILLRPTPESPGELHRWRVFDSKTWNPIALAGDVLLVRNDLEAACLRLPLR